MKPHEVELALKKQRLRIRAETQRADMLNRLAGIEAALDSIDRVRDHTRWAVANAPLLSGALLFLVLRPRRLWRFARRAWVGWLLLKKARRSAGPFLAALQGFWRRRTTS